MSGGFQKSALQRVTIVASHRDDTLIFLQADYASSADSSLRTAGPARAAAIAAPTNQAVAAPTSLAALPSPRAGNTYNSGRGIELYASTQRLPAKTPATYIDVHA
jgi:hypothetical protein